MRLLQCGKLALAGGLLIALAVGATPALGAPAGQDNLLANPDFEGSFGGEEYTSVPEGWSPWWQEDATFSRPNFNPSEGVPERLKSGLRAASYWIQYRRYNAGLFQRVGATPGARYRFTIWGHSLTRPSGNVQMQIGIDPNGGGDPFSSSIVWSGVLVPMGTYQQFTVEATAAGNEITVYLRAAPDYPVEQSETYWDTASLTVVGQAAPTNTPPAGGSSGGTSGGSSGVPAGSIQPATPLPDGSVVHVVQPGETLIGIAVTYNVTLEQLRQLNNLQTDMVFVGQRLLISEPLPPTPTTPPPTPTTAPEVAEAATQQAALQVTNGTICIMSYSDLNANGIREPEEPKQAGITFLVNDSTGTVGTYTTNGLDEPYCFTELASGNYTVSWTADGFTPTTEQTWVANVSQGSTVSREFGVAGGEATEGESGQGGGGLSPLLTALIGALGVILLLVGLGAAGYFLLLRRAQV